MSSIFEPAKFESWIANKKNEKRDSKNEGFDEKPIRFRDLEIGSYYKMYCLERGKEVNGKKVESTAVIENALAGKSKNARTVYFPATIDLDKLERMIANDDCFIKYKGKVKQNNFSMYVYDLCGMKGHYETEEQKKDSVTNCPVTSDSSSDNKRHVKEPVVATKKQKGLANKSEELLIQESKERTAKLEIERLRLETEKIKLEIEKAEKLAKIETEKVERDHRIAIEQKAAEYEMLNQKRLAEEAQAKKLDLEMKIDTQMFSNKETKLQIPDSEFVVDTESEEEEEEEEEDKIKEPEKDTTKTVVNKILEAAGPPETKESSE